MRSAGHAIDGLLCALVSTALSASACSGGQDDAPAARDANTAALDDRNASTRDAPDETCPMAVPGTSVRMIEIEGGAALEVTTTGDIAEVRARAGVMAEHHGLRLEEHARMHADALPAATAGHEPERMGGVGTPEIEPAAGGGVEGTASVAVRVEEIERGARLVLVPRKGGGRDAIEAVRTHARRVASRMGAGRCPLMMM